MNRHRLPIASSLLLAPPALATRHALFNDDALIRLATAALVLPVALATIGVGLFLTFRLKARLLSCLSVVAAGAALVVGMMALWSSSSMSSSTAWGAGALIGLAVIFLLAADRRALVTWLIATIVVIVAWPLAWSLWTFGL